jgi:hypothetical protein
MTNKIVDISDELFNELGEPDDISIATVAFWLRTNIGSLNVLLNKPYTINQSSLEVEGSSTEPFDINEKAIFKKLYIIHYYDRQLRKTLNSISLDSVVSISDEGSSVTKVNKNELSKTFSSIKKQEMAELKELLNKYELNEVAPLQVAGDDTIPGTSNEGNQSANIYHRSI